MFGTLKACKNSMDTPTKKDTKNYRTSFIWGTVIGGFMLLLSAVAYILEVVYPGVRSTLVWPSLMPAVLMLFMASLDYSRYLNSSR